MATYDSVVLYRANVCDGQGTAKGMDLGLAVNGELKQSQSFPTWGNNRPRDALFTWAGKLPYYTELNELAGVARCRESGTQCKINRRQMLLLQALDPDVKFYYTYSDVEVPTPELAGDGVYYDDTEAKLTVPVDEDSLIVVLYNASPNPEHNGRIFNLKVKVNGSLTSVYSRMWMNRAEPNWIPFLYTFEASPGTYEIQGAFAVDNGGVVTSIKKRWLIAMVFPLSLKFDYWYLNDATDFEVGRCYTGGTGWCTAEGTIWQTTFRPSATSDTIILSTAVNYGSASTADWYGWKLYIDGSSIGVTYSSSKLHSSPSYRVTGTMLYATTLESYDHEIKLNGLASLYHSYWRYLRCASRQAVILAFHKE